MPQNLLLDSVASLSGSHAILQSQLQQGASTAVGAAAAVVVEGDARGGAALTSHAVSGLTAGTTAEEDEEAGEEDEEAGEEDEESERRGSDGEGEAAAERSELRTSGRAKAAEALREAAAGGAVEGAGEALLESTGVQRRGMQGSSLHAGTARTSAGCALFPEGLPGDAGV
jgi:hypothetical protein